MRFIILYTSFLFASTVSAFVDTARLDLSAYAEAYCQRQISHVDDNSRPSFLYNHTVNNRPALNLIYVKAALTTDRFRYTLAVMDGSYSDANLAAEPKSVRHFLEHSAGVKLSKTKEIWLDGGILPSHIGFESAVGADCQTVTRSLVAENSPYFETGVRLSQKWNGDKWYAAVLALNGWQRIAFQNGQSFLSIGGQLTYKPNTSLTLNYSNFYGTGFLQKRLYHNLYSIWQVKNRLTLTTGFDFGTDFQGGQKGAQSWYTPVCIARQQLASKWWAATRMEYFSDAKGVLIQPGIPFKKYGFSANVDFKPVRQIMLRCEYRHLGSPTGVGSSPLDAYKQLSSVVCSVIALI